MLLVIGFWADSSDPFLLNCSSSLTKLGQGKFCPFASSASRVKEDVTGSVKCVMLRYKLIFFLFENVGVIHEFVLLSEYFRQYW